MATTIRLLCENLATDMRWQAEWGFSALITHHERQVLFDTGYSDVWQRNAEIAGVDLEEIEVIALSHLHRDHTRGLLHHQFTPGKRVVCHPRVLESVSQGDVVLKEIADASRQSALADYGTINRILRDDFIVETATEPTEIAPDVIFLGEIPRVNSFERGAFFDDPMPDDTALAIRHPKGVIVVSGCSHAGICNICEAAKAATGLPLYAVIGGFHLMHAERPPVEATIAYFKDEAPEVLLPMHCVDFEYMAAFYAAFGMPRRGAGEVITL